VVVEQLMVSARMMIATPPATAAPLVIAPIAGFELLEVPSSDASIGIGWEHEFER
jgi:hypothetical protein